ncbi:MAG: hypothetical protein AAF570_13535, partial [Bacteroidota bacterium]
MPTTLKGTLHGTDTKDTCELTRKARKYDYECKASGGGKLRLKIKYQTTSTDSLTSQDTGKEVWRTVVDREKIASGNTVKGSFTLPTNGWSDTKGTLKV